MPTRKANATADGGARHARHLRSLNLERVLNVAMDRPGPFTRAELIEATGLSAPTVGSLAAELIRNGVVKDLGTGPSSGGRRPFAMELNARHGYVAGIDLGPTRTRLAVADLRGDRVADRIVDTPMGVSPEALLQRVADAVRDLMRDAGAPARHLVVVGAGGPLLSAACRYALFDPSIAGHIHHDSNDRYPAQRSPPDWSNEGSFFPVYRIE
jgi:glucokinase